MTEELAQLIEDQANDEGLWFCAETITEQILQTALRDLHAAVERALRQSPQP